LCDEVLLPRDQALASADAFGAIKRFLQNCPIPDARLNRVRIELKSSDRDSARAANGKATAFAPARRAHPVSKSPDCGGASGVNRQRSGLRSTSGVLSRQSRPLTLRTGPSRLTRVTSAVPIGFGRTGERSENVPRVAPSSAGL